MSDIPHSTRDDPPRLDFGEFYGRVVREADGSAVSVREVADLPPSGVPRHTHEHAHFCLVVSGSYEARARNFEGRCPRSLLLFHPSGTTHEDGFLAPGGRTVMVSLDSGVLASFGDPGLPRWSVALHDAEIGFPGSRLRRELRRPDRYSELSVESLTLEMVGAVVDRVGRAEERPAPWLDRAVEFLRARAMDPARVSEVAEAAGVHPVHLARVIRRHLGVSPGEYLRRVRVQDAMARIEGTEAPLASIAVRAGFCDQSEMTRAFRRELDTTPGAYRKAVRR